MNKKVYSKSTALLVTILFIGFSFLPMISGDDVERGNNLEIVVENIDLTRIHISSMIPDFQFSIVDIEDDKFTSIELIDAGQNTIEGQAKLPVIRRMIEIPQGSIPQIQMISESWESISLSDLNMPSRVIPIQPSLMKPESDENDFVIDENYYDTDAFFPEEKVKVLEINQIRGRRFALVEITPVLYNPAQGKLQLLVDCEINMDLSEGFDLTSTKNSIERYSSPDFEEMYQHIFQNYGYYESIASENKDPEGFLIIVHDDFNDEITPLANWKNTMGYTTTVTLTSEIPGGVTADNIKSYIETAYTSWSPPPSYILLVGDTPQIPAHTGPDSGGETDSLFVRMDGDIFADIYIGRFPAATGAQVDAMVDKTIYYEQGNFPSDDWIKKAAFIASSDQSQLAEDTHNYVIDTHLEPNGYFCDKIYEASGGNTQDISDAVNDGRSLCIYSGHGSTTSWGCVPFGQSDVNALTNDGMYPFVTSHACVTGSYELGECYGETWIRAESKGAIAFWGSSINTHWTEDDIIEKRVFDAWWNLGLDKIGQMTDKGMYDSYQEYGSGMEDFIESYNVLGDASVKIWSDEQGPELSYNPSFYYAGNMLVDTVDSTSFDIWNSGSSLLTYTLSESATWVDLSSYAGDSSGEHDPIIVDIDTTGLTVGVLYECEVSISSDGGAGIFLVTVFIVNETTELLDVEQSIFNRGFRLMPGWDGAQEFIPTYGILSSVDLYLSKFGSPTGDITFQICEDSAGGTVVYEGVVSPGDVPSFPDYEWVTVDISDITVTPGNTYYIVLKDAVGADTHNCVQWGWCDSFASGSGGPYSGGWFWFRKEANPTWSPIRDWDFTVRTYGLI